MAARAKEDGPEPEEIAAYVAAMALELKALVEPHQMASLAYLLDLVRMEAEEQAGGESGRYIGMRSS